MSEISEIEEDVTREPKLISEDTKAEFHLLYNFVVGDIKFAKEQQWKITNYVSAIYVAIYGIWRTITLPTISYRYGIELWCFATLGLLVLAVGIWMVYVEQDLLNRSRDRIGYIVESFTEDFKRSLMHQAPSTGDGLKLQ